MDSKDYKVTHIERKDCEEYILNIHYAKRWPSITWAFGLFYKEELCGIVSYGTPPSSTLRTGLAGEEFEANVLELNRLCLRYNRHNEASMLISRSLKLLPQNSIIVSYADTGQNHAGCVYQATNFLYTGLSIGAKILKVRGKEHLHNITLLDEARGQPSRIEYLRAKYGDALYQEANTRKHRYVYLHGSRKFKKLALSALNYKPRKYPKALFNVKEMEDEFNMVENVSDSERGEELSSKDFEGILI